MTGLLRDFRYATRILAKSPGATSVAILALALGIGVNASCFTGVKGLVLEPLPFPKLNRLMTLWDTVPKLRAERAAVAPANFLDWRRDARSFESLAAYRPWNVNLTGQGDPERVEACLVTPEFFSALGMAPRLGRTFSRDEEAPGRDGVVVVSHGFWQRRLGSAADATGKTVRLGGRDYVVAGVMPEEFDFPLATDLWVPLTFSNEDRAERSSHSLMVLGRLKDGVAPAHARAEMTTIARRLERQYPETNEGRDAAVVPLLQLINNVTDRFTLTMMGAAGFVLLLAVANVANLQLSRAAGRRKEVAVQAALGAGRFRIARQLLAESIVVSLAGGSLGLVLAAVNSELTWSAIPAQVAHWVAGIRNMRVDGKVAVFTLAVAILAGVASGLPAAFHLLRRKAAAQLNEGLKEGGRSSNAGPSRSRLRSALVCTEVALALILLVGAGLMVRTFDRLLKLDPGFNPKNLLTMEIALPAVQYREDPSVAAFYDRVLRGIEGLGQVKSAGAAGDLEPAEGLFIEGRGEPRPEEPRPGVRTVSEHYLQALEIPVRRGRAITAQDGPDSQRVVVLGESVARHYWPDGDAIGRRVKLSPRSPWLTVVGVAGDVKDWFTGEPYPRAYVSRAQFPARGMSLAIRTSGDPMQAAAAARGQVRAVDRNQPVYDLKTMEQFIFEQTSGVRMAAGMMTTYAVIALLLAVTGIYAVSAYAVVQRTHEIGIRMAFGADRGDVLRMIVFQVLRVAVVGLAIGVPVSFVLMRLMSSLLYNVVPVEPLAFAAFTIVLGLSALLAAWLPARRATRIDPMVALREE